MDEFYYWLSDVVFDSADDDDPSALHLAESILAALYTHDDGYLGDHALRLTLAREVASFPSSLTESAAFNSDMSEPVPSQSVTPTASTGITTPAPAGVVRATATIEFETVLEMGRVTSRDSSTVIDRQTRTNAVLLGSLGTATLFYPISA